MGRAGQGGDDDESRKNWRKITVRRRQVDATVPSCSTNASLDMLLLTSAFRCAILNGMIFLQLYMGPEHANGH